MSLSAFCYQFTRCLGIGAMRLIFHTYQFKSNSKYILTRSNQMKTLSKGKRGGGGGGGGAAEQKSRPSFK